MSKFPMLMTTVFGLIVIMFLLWYVSDAVDNNSYTSVYDPLMKSLKNLFLPVFVLFILAFGMFVVTKGLVAVGYL